MLFRSIDDYGNGSMMFTDSAPTVCPTRLYNPNGNEYFYWTPEMPILAFEQAYQVLKHIELYPVYQELFNQRIKNEKVSKLKEILTDKTISDEIKKKAGAESHTKFNAELDLIKDIVYPAHDAAIFQAEKPMRRLGNFIGNSKDYYFETHSEIIPIKRAWHQQWKPWIDQFDIRYQWPPGFFQFLNTKKFFVSKINVVAK